MQKFKSTQIHTHRQRGIVAVFVSTIQNLKMEYGARVMVGHPASINSEDTPCQTS